VLALVPLVNLGERYLRVAFAPQFVIALERDGHTAVLVRFLAQ
jgi:hypothetical protein